MAATSSGDHEHRTGVDGGPHGRPLPVQPGAAPPVAPAAAERVTQARHEVVLHHGVRCHDQAAARVVARHPQAHVEVLGAEPEPLVEAGLEQCAAEEGHVRPDQGVDIALVVALLRLPLAEHVAVEAVRQLLALREVEFEREQRVVALQVAEHEAVRRARDDAASHSDGAIVVRGKQFPGPFGLWFAVIVEERHDGSGGGPDAGVARRRQAPVDLMTDHRRPVLPRDIACVVGRAVVHHDDLEFHVFLRGQGAQAPVDSRRPVERADHHAEVS